MRNFDKIVRSINNLRHDIKAEAIIADLIENGINSTDIVTIPEGLFKRRFNHDVSHAGIKKLNNGQEVLEIFITRDGIYDTLPEGLFHDQPSGNVNKGRDMAKESKKQRMEEKEVRRFFLPFENELFFQQMDIEREERKIVNRFSKNLFDDILPEFWNLNKSLPSKYLERLVLLLQYAHKISCSKQMMAKALEMIIDERVEVKRKFPLEYQDQNTEQSTEKLSSLGRAELGKGFTCGKASISLYPFLDFLIGPIRNTAFEDYLENGKVTNFLKCFFGYFVPIEMDCNTILILDKGEMTFSLNNSEQDLILGYNTAI